ncbi:gluconokinase [Pedobacter jamesrossensis]|uniref:Gluconokinase n=1 Tax=Pedobacter jamesrossensis TaxID=1908238 RepID=A0ABV8NLR9_9SPHI
MKYLIGVDIGTGSTKAVALNLEYQPIATSQFFYPTETTKPGYSEQNPELIWDAFSKSINELKGKLGDDPISVGLSSAMHSLILSDEEGNALAPMMTWADNRSSNEAKDLLASEAGRLIYQASGTPIHSMSPLTKLIWLKKHETELFQSASKFISIKEYIWFRLFGKFKIDYSLASATGLFNIHDLKWNPESLNLAGISAEKLSSPVQTDYQDSVLIDASKKSLPYLNTTFVIGASDGCLANLGSDATARGIAAITIGTSGALRLASSKPLINAVGMTFNYILDAETFICGGPVNNGGLALQWLLKNIFNKTELKTEDYKQLFKDVADTPAGSKGLIFLPYLTGERAPIWDSETCGNFFGLNLQHNQKHMARAVIEGICYALNDVLKAVEENAEPITQINVSGGFVHSKIWMQILANITGKKIVLVLQEDASSVGAAYLAAKAVGLTKNYPSSENTVPKIIMPDLELHKTYQRNFLLFKQLYTNLKETMHQLYHLNN